jgi:hypothetical protein
MPDNAPPLSPYWQQTARDLLTQFEPGRTFHWDTDAATWVGKAMAVLGEALRVCGDETGNDILTARETPPGL